MYPELDHGTTFKLYLPRVDEDPSLRKSSVPTARSIECTETILSVEDNHAVRDVSANLPRRLGYRPNIAEDAFMRLGFAPRLRDFIVKPFTMQQLGTKVRQIFDRLGRG